MRRIDFISVFSRPLTLSAQPVPIQRFYLVVILMSGPGVTYDANVYIE